MRSILPVAFLIFLGAIVFGQTGFCGQKTEKGTPAGDLLIKSEIETAISMLQTIYAKSQKGEMTFEQAKLLGADLLRGLRYGKDGYF